MPAFSRFVYSLVLVFITVVAVKADGVGELALPADEVSPNSEAILEELAALRARVDELERERPGLDLHPFENRPSAKTSDRADMSVVAFTYPNSAFTPLTEDTSLYAVRSKNAKRTRRDFATSPFEFPSGVQAALLGLEVQPPPTVIPFECHFSPTKWNLWVRIEWTNVWPSGS